MMEECSAPTCGNAIFVRGWCRTHYKRVLRHGDPQVHIPVKQHAELPCRIVECGQPQSIKGFCEQHYHDHLCNRTKAERQAQETPAQLHLRFWSKTTPGPSGCWLWQSTVSSRGYGVFSVGGKKVKAHRFAWRLLVGDPPLELEIDHLCRSKLCVNPGHFEWVSSAENIRRARLAKRGEWNPVLPPAPLCLIGATS